MKRKTAIKKLMGMGYSRNKANNRQRWGVATTGRNEWIFGYEKLISAPSIKFEIDYFDNKLINL